jgi:uncharacterized surface protein with fasciclin (FAS1) repeats
MMSPTEPTSPMSPAPSSKRKSKTPKGTIKSPSMPDGTKKPAGPSSANPSPTKVSVEPLAQRSKDSGSATDLSPAQVPTGGSSTPADLKPASPVPAGPTVVPSVEAPSGSTSPGKPASGTAATGTITEVASTNDKLKTFVTALKAAGLEKVLSGKGPYTVFAPTDEAFAAVPPEALQDLLKKENQSKLGQLLKYHVVSGNVGSTDIKPGETATLQGNPVDIKVDGAKVMINDANVVEADVPASNGVIHLIDKVILPSAK